MLTRTLRISIVTILLLAAVWTASCGKPAEPPDRADGESPTPALSPTDVPTATPGPSPTDVSEATPAPSPTPVAFPTPNPSPTPTWWVRRGLRDGYHDDPCELLAFEVGPMSLMGRHTLGFLDWATGGSLLVFDVDKSIGTVDTAGTEARTFADANPREEYWSND